MNLSCLSTIDCTQGAVRAVRFNVDGTYCLTCGADKKIKLWNPYRHLMLKTYGGHAGEVLDVCASCDSSQIVSCSADKSVIVWDVSTGQPLKRYRGHAAGATCLALNEDSTIAISGSLDNTLMCWDLRARGDSACQTLREAKDCISTVRISDVEILSGSVDGCARRYDLRNGKCDEDFVGASITSATFTRDGQCLLIGAADNKLRLLDKNTGELLLEYTGHKIDSFTIESEVITNDNYILSGSVDGNVWCWDLVSGEVKYKYTHERNKVVQSISVHPKKDAFLSASTNTIKLWGDASEIPLEEQSGN
uniref:WD repeat domain-containing protein 83 n=1 Tax=Dendroctonus ponderosae TaxID=77166 RepID=A0AAR5PKH4_DENPD